MHHDINGTPVEELLASDRHAAQERYLRLKQADDRPAAKPRPIREWGRSDLCRSCCAPGVRGEGTMAGKFIVLSTELAGGGAVAALTTEFKSSPRGTPGYEA
jgi:hypothetical protein